MIAAMTSADFIIAVMSLSDVLALTKPLSVLLQGLQDSSLQLDRAAEEVADLISVLSERRQEAEENFSELWKKTVEVAKETGVDDLKPRRICGRQDHRANHVSVESSSGTETYYRVSVFIPLLEHSIRDLQSRFPEEVFEVFRLPAFLPSNVLKRDGDTFLAELAPDMDAVIKRFLNFIPYNDGRMTKMMLEGELRLWRARWSRESIVPKNSTAVLIRCDKDAYPLVHMILTILTTLPVSNASAERSFSALRRLKTWLISTMTEQRLCGLALMHIHRDVQIDVQKVLDRFSKSAKRRIEFNV